mgnify:CR=1 FL=1
MLFSHPRWLSSAQNAFQQVPDIKVESSATLPPSNGELVGFINRGYPALGLVGSHRFFHTPRDLADTTSAYLLEPYGTALKQLMQAFFGVSSESKNTIVDSTN